MHSNKQNSKAVEKVPYNEMYNSIGYNYFEQRSKQSKESFMNCHRNKADNRTCKLPPHLSLSLEEGKSLRMGGQLIARRAEKIPKIFSNVKINSLNKSYVSRTLTVLDNNNDDVRPMRRRIYCKYANKVFRDISIHNGF
eukprot:TRINITY_DN4529_c0_g2_i1.p1 TRINITY_DN4529_c0_g2~~TRINITY_DN4529_c0_g2_i1.p1  ORF type:complete len:139 (-),score=19.03 TRINITY_DN4529_c0_g2_i1:104-520(-)